MVGPISRVPDPTPTAAGIDRWRGGWIVAERTSKNVGLWTCDNIEPAVERFAGETVVAIDMPLALAPTGRRSAEAEVRAALGSSARSVFTSPTRAAVHAATQAEATELNRAYGGPGISAQAYGLFASIRELRAALGSIESDNWCETHPETAFALMNGGVPLAGKRTGLGVGQRLAALREVFPLLDHTLLQVPAKVPIDDILDAFAALWSAERIANNSAVVFGSPDRDDEGFALGISV